MNARVWCLMAWMAAGVAHAGANEVEVKVDSTAPAGKMPSLTLVLHKDVKRALLDVDGGTARTKQQLGPGAAETSLVFTLTQKKPGQVNWKGTLFVEFADGNTGTMPLAFTTAVLSSFRFENLTTFDDVAAERVRIKSPKKTTKLSIEVYTDNDELLAQNVVPFDPPMAAGDVVTGSYEPRTEKQPLRLHIDVYDENDSYSSVDAFPFIVDIPHTDLEFETGKSIIRDSEVPKLLAALPEVKSTLSRYGPAMKVARQSMRFFVIGHTDTVGSSASNRALSSSRAAAIAMWFAREFKKQGIAVEVYARGVGEDMPKVETPDETDNAQNRRAEYNMSLSSPTGSIAGWRRVK
jgi:outer membrane protein OmpA-like peptidoglycan-associated protein